MCGIVGVLSNFENGFSMEETNVFETMLFLDTLRGFDSTGVFGVDSQANVHIAKAALNGLDFIGEEAFKKFRGELIRAGLFAVGHNRAATRGTIIDQNAHPFWVDDKIILVQNGTMRGDHKSLGTRTKDIEVDSEAIAHVLSEEDDIEEALQKINAAYALVWFNVETETLNMLRNYERPMWLAYGENNGMIFASEEATLLYAINRFKLRMKAPVELPTNTLLSFHIKGNHYETASKAIDNTYNGAPIWSPGNAITNYGYTLENPHNQSYHYPQNPPKRHSFSNANNDIDIQFSDYVIENLPEHHMHHSDVDAEQKAAMESVDKQTGKLFIEVLDFIPTNKHPGCSSWHVYGELILSGDAKSKVLVHWIMYDKTKEVMEKYIEPVYFWCH